MFCFVFVSQRSGLFFAIGTGWLESEACYVPGEILTNLQLPFSFFYTSLWNDVLQVFIKSCGTLGLMTFDLKAH